MATSNVGAVQPTPSAAQATTLVEAQTATWSGGGPDNLWSDGANWSSSAAPNPGDDLVFQGAVQTATDNDLPAGTLLDSMTLASPGFVLAGNGVTLASASAPVVALTAAAGTIQLPITLASDATFAITNPQGSLTDSGNINNGGYGLTVATSSSQPSTLGGSISGAGGIVKTGAGTVILGGTNSFSGGTTVTGGTLVIATAAALADGSSLTVGAGASLFAANPAAVPTWAAADSAGAVAASALSVAASSSVIASPAATSGAGVLTPATSVVASTTPASTAGPLATDLAMQQLMTDRGKMGPSLAVKLPRSLSPSLPAHIPLVEGHFLPLPGAAWIWDLMASQNDGDKSSRQLPDAISIDKLLEMDL